MVSLQKDTLIPFHAAYLDIISTETPKVKRFIMIQGSKGQIVISVGSDVDLLRAYILIEHIMSEDVAFDILVIESIHLL